MQWDTDAFAKAELPIVESLAQFYTQVVCWKLKDRFPDALDAFSTLLSLQAHHYHAHLDWGSDDEKHGEIVRVSMIECRIAGVTTYPTFLELVRRNRGQLKKRSRPGVP